MAGAMTESRRVGVLGASSLVGQCLLSRLAEAEWSVSAYSRRPGSDSAGVEWRQLPSAGGEEQTLFTTAAKAGIQPAAASGKPTPAWVCVAPIWVLPDYFSLLEAAGARRLVALSSTSRFTKIDSGDAAEAAVAACLIETEQRVAAWAESRGIEWLVLRPTLIYGLGRDRNIAEMARFIRRFRFFPVLGRAMGLRQPIHADDVAQACVSALSAAATANRAYDICGAETLPYRELVGRVFGALGRSPRIVTVPLWAFRLAVAMVRHLPRCRHWSAAMAERMNRDLVFDCGDARRDLGFAPRLFRPGREDVASWDERTTPSAKGAPP